MWTQQTNNTPPPTPPKKIINAHYQAVTILSLYSVEVESLLCLTAEVKQTLLHALTNDMHTNTASKTQQGENYSDREKRAL